MSKIERYFRPVLVLIILIKLLMAYLMPITSDESYFYLWGQFPALNYYDHPPLTGWIMALFGLLGHHIFFARLFTLASGLLIALGIHRIVSHGFKAPDKARLICLAFLVSPLHMLMVLITTDMPLMLFVFLSGAAFFFALKRRSDWIMLLAGVFWGLAVLSKYFAVLLWIAFACALFLGKRRQPVRNLFLLTTGALPLLLLHLYANYQNCWTNILFNVINRNQQVTWKISGLLTFAAFQIYLATPWVLYYLIRNAKPVAREIKAHGNLFIWLLGVPVALLAVVSLHHTGLHWAISFYPFLFLLLVPLPARQIKRIVIFSTALSVLHVVPLLTLLSLPVETFKGLPYYHDLVLCKYGRQLYHEIETRFGPYDVLATNGYYTSAAMTYHSGEHVIVFLDDSKHGREDDKLTDFRTLDGKNILILSTLPFEKDYAPYFDALQFHTLTLHGSIFHVVVGHHFRYAVYRDRFLKRILKQWYAIPDFLPRGDCYFKRRYFEGP